jgi:hypothetical protein
MSHQQAQRRWGGGPGKIEQRVRRSNRQAFRALGNFDDFVASPDLASEIGPRNITARALQAPT